MARVVVERSRTRNGLQVTVNGKRLSPTEIHRTGSGAKYLVAPEQRHALRRAAGSRPAPADRRLLWLRRQSRARTIRAREGMNPPIRIDSEPQGYRLSVDQIRRACQILEVKQPVRIFTVTWSREHPRERDRGDYDFLGGEHVIRLDDDPRASPAKLSERLWHELCHARQREEHGATYSTKYAVEQASVGYDGNRFEVEARALAADLGDGLELVR